MIVSRRGFLKGAAAGVVAAAVPQLVQPAGLVVPGTPSILPTDVTDPGNASSQTGGLSMPKISGVGGQWDKMYDAMCVSGDCLFHFDPKRQIITYVGTTGFTLQEMYSSAKDQFKGDNVLIQHAFPMTAITSEYMRLQGGWNVNPSSWDWMRVGCCMSEDGTVKMVALIGLSGWLHDNELEMYLQHGDLPNVERVNPWGQVVRITDEVPFLRWKWISKNYCYGETKSADLGLPCHRDFFHSLTGSIRYPFYPVTDYYVKN